MPDKDNKIHPNTKTDKKNYSIQKPNTAQKKEVDKIVKKVLRDYNEAWVKLAKK